MTPISALIAAIVARVLDRRRSDAALLKTHCSLSSSFEQAPVPEEPVDDRPRYGGVNGGPLVSDVTDPVERMIRETFDQFDDVYLRGKKNWLARQCTGRLCEDIIRKLRWASVIGIPISPVPEDPELQRMADAWREPEAGG
jgi:hypothetical protein